MKKLLLIALLSLTGSSLMAMYRPEVMREDSILVAIRDNNLTAVKAAVEAGAPVDEIKYLIGYIGEHPLVRALSEDKYTIAEYLLSKGADKSLLNSFLDRAAKAGNVEKVKWFLAHGAKDNNDIVLTAIKEYQADEPYAPLKLKYSQIINLLEQSKKGPLKLTPLVKPVAQPAVAQPQETQKPYISDAARLIGIAQGGKEEASVVAKPAAQPVRLVPTAKPIAKPAAAKPMTMAETLEEIARNPKAFGTGTTLQK